MNKIPCKCGVPWHFHLDSGFHITATQLRGDRNDDKYHRWILRNHDTQDNFYLVVLRDQLLCRGYCPDILRIFTEEI